jgi:hypothetical protein
VLVGLVLFVVSFPVLFLNEGNSVTTAKSLEEGRGAVVSVAADNVAPTNAGKLVHLNGEATTTETLSDGDFGVSANAIKLIRDVEMYQWAEEKKSETKKKLGGGEETVTKYTYETKWSDRAIDSSDFKDPVGHTNPGEFPVQAHTTTASKVTLGAFTLSGDLVDRLNESAALAVDAARLPAAMQGKAQAASGGYYLGGNPSSPQIGDTRVSFKVVKPAVVTVVAAQVGDTFEPYQTKAGKALSMLRYGTLSADGMIDAAQRENTILTWILRFVGFLCMFFGLTMIFRPIAVFADVIPLFGTLLGAGIGIFAGLTAAILSLLVIAVAWIFFRPLLGITLLLLAIGGIVLLVRVGLKKRAARAAAPGTAQRGAA